MNQENNQFNVNNFNNQSNNGMPNNQPLNNQSVNQGMGINNQSMNPQPQPTQSFQQPIMQEPIQQPMNSFNDLNNNSFNSKPPKKNYKRHIILLTILALILICSGLLISYICNNKNNKTVIDESTTVTELLWQDFQKGKITTDEYVKNILYAEYDNDLLDKKYQLVKTNDLIHTDDIVNKYYDELSEETLKYYLSKINLDNITFETNKENEENEEDDSLALLDLFVDEVYAKSEDTTNLNKAILSSNGNFVVWYTTSGNSATDYESVKKVADGLEQTVSLYKEKFGHDYYYKSNTFSKGSRYKDQIKILENSNIDSKYLESAMQVYLVNYNDGSLAKYMGNSGALIKLWNSLKGGDTFGVVANPYILIKPSSFNDYERLEQLYNHELFHHYQYEILCGHSGCSTGGDPYILEASANWASSLVSTKTTNSGYLNEWASSARMLSDTLLSDESIEYYSEGTLAYALFVYLYNYSNIVDNGVNKIVNSIYSNNLLEYLIDNATLEELADIQETIAFKNLSQDYENKNLNADLGFNPTLPIRATISHENEKYKSNNTYYNFLMSPISHNYYLISDNSDYAYQIHIERDHSTTSEFINATIIKFYEGKFSIVDSSKNSNESYTFNTNNYGNYDDLYIVISNTYTNRKNGHTLNIKEIKKEETNQEEKNYVSLIDCDAYFDEYKEQQINTYYFNEDDIVNKWVVTTFWTNEDDAQSNYENNNQNSNYTNVKISGKVVTFEYTEEALNKYFPSMTKDNVIYNSVSSCSLTCSNSNCTWEELEEQEIMVDYNPSNFK